MEEPDRPANPLRPRSKRRLTNPKKDTNAHENLASVDQGSELRTLWLEAVARSVAAVNEAFADGGLDRALAISEWSERPNLRRVLVDLIEEYARHTGHADLIRESTDGLVGEDAPH